MTTRQNTKQINVGGVTLGGGAPVRIQSMTTTKTADVEATLAQIAALAESHYVISKSSDSNKSVTNISRLDYEGRVNELSRIISGGEITENIRNTAIEMLNKSLT